MFSPSAQNSLIVTWPQLAASAAAATWAPEGPAASDRLLREMSDLHARHAEATAADAFRGLDLSLRQGLTTLDLPARTRIRVLRSGEHVFDAPGCWVARVLRGSVVACAAPPRPARTRRRCVPT